MDVPHEFRLTGLTGREYKMMLKPKRFAGDPERAARRFWKILAKVIADRIEGGGDLGDFDALFEDPILGRPVRFRDTRKLLLDSQGYSLRIRGEGQDQEVTLKLRTPDIFFSGLTSVLGNSGKAKPKFEEDIAPLEVQRRGGVTSSEEPSTRSRFSRSTTMPLPVGDEPETLGVAFQLFPDLRQNLTATTGRVPKARSELIEGPPISEFVFKSEGLKLSRGVEIGFAITIWYFDRKKKWTLEVAEVSFKWEIEKRDKNGATTPLKPLDATDEADRREKLRQGAARAQSLFIAMQKDLAGWIDKDNASKTKLGLPDPP